MVHHERRINAAWLHRSGIRVNDGLAEIVRVVEAEVQADAHLDRADHVADLADREGVAAHHPVGLYQDHDGVGLDHEGLSGLGGMPYLFMIWS